MLENPRYGLPRLPFCTVRVAPVNGFLRPSGSATVAVELTFCAFSAVSSAWSFGLMFTFPRNRCVPLFPTYETSIEVVLFNCIDTVRFQFWMYGVLYPGEIENPPTFR